MSKTDSYFIILLQWVDDDGFQSLGVKRDGAIYVSGEPTQDGDVVMRALVEFAMVAEKDKERYNALESDAAQHTCHSCKVNEVITAGVCNVCGAEQHPANCGRDTGECNCGTSSSKSGVGTDGSKRMFAGFGGSDGSKK
jgi:hypothetical protein